MAQIKGPVSGAYADVQSVSKALLTTRLGPDIGSAGGRYRCVTYSASLAATAAFTSSAGHLWAFRNAHASQLSLIEKLKVSMVALVLPASTHQEFGVIVHQTTAHTVQPTGGAAVALTTPQLKMRTSQAVPTSTIYYEDSTGGALTAGTYTMKTQPLALESGWANVAGAAVPKPSVVLERNFENAPIVLAPDEGLLVSNFIALADSLSCRLIVEVEWREVAAFAQ